MATEIRKYPDGISKCITNYYLEVDGKRTKFRTKSFAIEIGKLSIKLNPKTKLIERYILWFCAQNKTKVLDKQEFDRTILLY